MNNLREALRCQLLLALDPVGQSILEIELLQVQPLGLDAFPRGVLDVSGTHDLGTACAASEPERRTANASDERGKGYPEVVSELFRLQQLEVQLVLWRNRRLSVEGLGEQLEDCEVQAAWSTRVTLCPLACMPGVGLTMPWW